MSRPMIDLMSVIRDLSLAQAQQFQREREAGLIDPRETPVSDDDSWYRQQDEDEQWIQEHSGSTTTSPKSGDKETA